MFKLICIWTLVWILEGWSDRMVFKNRPPLFGKIIKETPEEILYLDAFDRPRKEKQITIDSIWYDQEQVEGNVKTVFRAGQPTDKSGYIPLGYAERMDLELEYMTDSVTEIDFFFKSNVHIRMTPQSHFKIIKAPDKIGETIKIALFKGALLFQAHHRDAKVNIKTKGGIVVGRGRTQSAVITQDSTVTAICLQGLVGIQENEIAFGELVVDSSQALTLSKKDGLFMPLEVEKKVIESWNQKIKNMGHYQLRSIEYPPTGWLAKAFTGFGFMVFFYGTTVGVLNYVNNI